MKTKKGCGKYLGYHYGAGQKAYCGDDNGIEIQLCKPYQDNSPPVEKTEVRLENSRSSQDDKPEDSFSRDDSGNTLSDKRIKLLDKFSENTLLNIMPLIEQQDKEAIKKLKRRLKMRFGESKTDLIVIDQELNKIFGDVLTDNSQQKNPKNSKFEDSSEFDKQNTADTCINCGLLKKHHEGNYGPVCKKFEVKK